MAVDAINVSEPTYLFDLSTVRLVFPCILLTVRLIGARLTIRTCPLMGRTYSRLGATLGSPKLRLLSLLSHFRLLLSVLSLRSSKLFLDLSLLFRALLCAAPLSATRRPCPIYTVLLRAY